MLVLYSDGVTEAGIDGGKNLAKSRLIHTLRRINRSPPEALVQKIVDAV